MNLSKSCFRQIPVKKKGKGSTKREVQGCHSSSQQASSLDRCCPQPWPLSYLPRVGIQVPAGEAELNWIIVIYNCFIYNAASFVHCGPELGGLKKERMSVWWWLSIETLGWMLISTTSYQDKQLKKSPGRVNIALKIQSCKITFSQTLPCRFSWESHVFHKIGGRLSMQEPDLHLLPELYLP